jgi:uncharacterized protein (DUF58 family)
MTAAQSTGHTPGALRAVERDAHQLADRLPDLLIEASRISSTIAHGIHGRRRAGPGETFWQFRQLEAQDPVQLIDWRRSASSDLLYVREREWEAAHTIWLWPDLSPSMRFKSHLSHTTKHDRALVMTLAAAELLVRSGERVGLLGLTQPMASRRAALRLSETIAAPESAATLSAGLPPKARLSRFASAILISDFLDPIDHIRDYAEALAAQGVNAHLMQILDPAEETLPYEGRAEFLGIEGDERWLAERAETLRGAYQQRLAEHRGALAAMATRLGWSFLVHHTDRSAADALLALVMRLEGKPDGYRWQGQGSQAPSDLAAVLGAEGGLP